SILKKKLRVLYRACLHSNKLIYLDMEEYADLSLTRDLFQGLLEEEEFQSLTQGIALQSYIPDSFEIQKELIRWAYCRQQKGHAPIRIRLVKGSNLGMEKIEASIKGWQ